MLRPVRSSAPVAPSGWPTPRGETSGTAKRSSRWGAVRSGGIKSINFEKLIAKAPERVIETAVKGMLPKNPLGRDMYRKLKVYKGDQHPHAAQQPKKLKIA